MSSEGCSMDPLLSGSFVHHLQDRLLSLPELGSDLESDESVYYDVDSPPASPLQEFSECQNYAAKAGPTNGDLERAVTRDEATDTEADSKEKEAAECRRKDEAEREEKDVIECEEPILLDGGRETTPEKTVDSSDDEDSERGRPELKRCSSLKTSKLPAGSPCEKKIVRFADALGLDLAAVRTFMDDVPRIPKSAFKDLEVAESPSTSPLAQSYLPPCPPEKTVVPLFQQPGKRHDFAERLHAAKVCLESATVTDPALSSVMGVVRVLNIGYTKAVFVRYSKDNWKTHFELQAKYVENSCDGRSDKFAFTLFAHTLNIGDRLEFALRYDVNQCQYWDNNSNANYAFQCVPESPTRSSAFLPSAVSLDSWGTFL